MWGGNAREVNGGEGFDVKGMCVIIHGWQVHGVDSKIHGPKRHFCVNHCNPCKYQWEKDILEVDDLQYIQPQDEVQVSHVHRLEMKALTASLHILHINKITSFPQIILIFANSKHHSSQVPENLKDFYIKKNPKVAGIKQWCFSSK